MPVVGMDPDPHMNLLAFELPEDHADLLVAVDRDEPGRLFGVESLLRRADLVVEARRRAAGTVARGADLVGARGEISRSDFPENGRSTMVSPELAGRSLNVKLSRWFMSSSSAAIFLRESLVS